MTTQGKLFNGLYYHSIIIAGKLGGWVRDHHIYMYMYMYTGHTYRLLAVEETAAYYIIMTNMEFRSFAYSMS